MANIRWRKKDLTKLGRYVGKFNASITNMEKKFPELADSGILPARMDKSQLMSRISTRKDFNMVINRIDRWFKKGAREIVTLDSGIRTTKWQKREIQYAERSINRRTKQIQEKSGLTEKGLKEIGLGKVDVKSKLDEIKENIEQKIRHNNTNIRNEQQNWNNFLKKIFSRQYSSYYDELNAKYRENYYKALRRELNPDQAEAIIKMIEEMGLSDEQFFYMTITNDDLDIPYIYGAEDRAAKYEIMMEEMPQYYEELKEEGYFT